MWNGWRRAGTELESRRPTEGAGVSVGVKRDFKAQSAVDYSVFVFCDTLEQQAFVLHVVIVLYLGTHYPRCLFAFLVCIFLSGFVYGVSGSKNSYNSTAFISVLLRILGDCHLILGAQLSIPPIPTV